LGVGYGSGIGCVLAPKFDEALGEPWVLDHRGGVGRTIAAEIVSHPNP
jgi:hypothetical protein